MTTVPVPTLVPFRHELRWTRALAVVGSVLPPLAVTVLVGLADGRPGPVVVLTGLVLGTCALVALLVLGSRIALRPDGVRRHRLLGSDTVLRTHVAKAVVRRVQNRDEITAQRHLFLLDADDRVLLRLSDRWWTEQQMRQVADHLGVRIEAHGDLVYVADLRRSVRHQLRWQEQHPWLWGAMRVISVGAAALVLAALANAAV